MFLDCSFVLPPPTSAATGGICVTDVDGDGRPEFVVAVRGGPNRVFKCFGNALRDVTPPLLAAGDRDTLATVAGDFDGDGREEIYLLNAGPDADRLLDCRADGKWVDLFESPRYRHARDPRPARTAAVLDRRGHGRYGFLLASDDRPPRLLELNTANAVCDMAPALDLDGAAGSGLVVGPLASERPDVFATSDRGPNLLHRNTGLGTYLEVAAEHGLREGADRSHAAAIFDADGDGRLDICFGSRTGPHRLLVRGDRGRFRNAASPAMGFPSEVQTLLAADFDNDGYEELLFLNCGESNRLFRQTADGLWQLADAGPLDGWGVASTAAAVADVDGDGRLELLVSNGPAPPQLFKGPDAGHGWLRVVPRTRFGAPARGAVVRLLAGGRTQVRPVCSGSGYRCQMEPVAHFGLGACEAVEHVQVTWPDETVAIVERPAINRTLEVKYPGA